MKKILIALVAVFSIVFIKHSEASTSLMLIKETASFISVGKVMSLVTAEPSCGVKGCQYPGDHDEKHENQLYLRPFLWDKAQERYREATEEETDAINNMTEVNFPESDEGEEETVIDMESEDPEEEEEEAKESKEEEEEKDPEDDIDDFFKDTFGDGDEDEEDYEEEEEEVEIEDEDVDIEIEKDEEEVEEMDEADNSEEDDYFGDDDEYEGDNKEREEEKEEDFEDLDISDWGIKLKEKLDREVDKAGRKVEQEVDKEIEKLKRKIKKRKKSTDDSQEL